MDAFNQKYHDRVDKKPYSTHGPTCQRDEVDDTVWEVTINGRSSSESWYTSFFKGKKHAGSQGKYHCELTEIMELSDNSGSPPYVQPGDPRPPDWHVAGLNTKSLADVSNAQRKWTEEVSGRAAGAGRGLPGRSR